MTREIQTSTLPGFPELLPNEQVVFDNMKETIRRVYERFGFTPLETPIVERTEVLFAKEEGETSKQIYKLNHGDGDMALRFDHTVPLARYVAEHNRELTFPFRRYSIGRVYRGERSQKGRFREFYQCDIDVIGDGTLDLAHDADVLAVISATFDALGIGRVTIRLSNRKVLAGLAESLGLGDGSTEVFRIIDKLRKIGETASYELLAEICSPETAGVLIQTASISGTPSEVVARLRSLGVDNEKFNEGVQEIETVANFAFGLGVPEGRLVVDIGIARGLDYYTGTVYETFLSGYEDLGSICSGGRFDDLAGAFTNRAFPGVGISIGLSRLFAQLKEVGLINIGASTPTRVLVVPLLTDLQVPLSIADALRQSDIPTEVYLEDKKAKTKFAYADRQGIPIVVIVGEDEIKKGTCLIKLLTTGEQNEVSQEEVVNAVFELLK